MKSIFHIEADTPEDLRREILTWLSSRAQSYEDAALHQARNQHQRIAYYSSSKAFREAHDFWQSVIIDPKSKLPNYPGPILENRDKPTKTEGKV